MNTDQITTDVDFLTSQPGWQDRAGRRDYIRGIAAKSLEDDTMDPVHHASVMSELWKRSDDRGLIKQAADFTGTSLSELAASAPSPGAALMIAGSDALNYTETGSGVRLKRGALGLADAAVQRVKAFHPDDRQEQRDFALDALKKDLDARAYPEGLEAWIAGAPQDELDDDTKTWIHALTYGLGRKTVAADHSGEIDPEKLRAWVESDRSPWRADSDTGGPGPRALLGDYLVTRDPSSWEAFVSRVSETDAQRETRMKRHVAEFNTRGIMERRPDGFLKRQAERAMDFQGSPVDITMTLFPFLKGAKAFSAAKSGAKGTAVKEIAQGTLGESVSESLTEALQDPNAPTSRVLEAGAMGAIGAAVFTGGAAATGAVMEKLLKPKVKIRDFDRHGRLTLETEMPREQAQRTLRGRMSLLQMILDCLRRKGVAA